MKKKNFLRIIKVLAITAMGFLFVACGNGEDTSTGEGDTENTLNVVSSFSILTDMIEEIGGEYVGVHNLVPIGTDPLEYEPLPEDIKVATDGDLLVYYGLNLEDGVNDWFFKLANYVGKTEENHFE